MTVLKQGSGSGITGLVGRIVLAQRNGKPYLRSAPRRKKGPGTPGQILYRQRFSKVNSFCNLFKYSLIPQIWNDEADKMSGYALFLKTNMPAFEADGSITDMKLLQLSTGELPLPKGLEAHRLEADPATISVGWQKDSHIGGIPLKDELMVVSAADGNYSEITGTGIIRHALGGTFQLPELPVEATHLYLFFGSKNRRDYSESISFEI